MSLKPGSNIHYNHPPFTLCTFISNSLCGGSVTRDGFKQGICIFLALPFALCLIMMIIKTEITIIIIITNSLITIIISIPHSTMLIPSLPFLLFFNSFLSLPIPFLLLVSFPLLHCLAASLLFQRPGLAQGSRPLKL